MKTWLVACSKGGVGKTTIATQLAANAALSGLRTVLVDADPQGSATRWCERRAGMASAVLPVDGTRKSWRKRVPDDAQRVVVDAPAGASEHGELVAIINCSGTERLDSPDLRSALIRSLLERGWVRATGSGFGIRVSDDLETDTAGLYVIGPMLTGNVLRDDPAWNLEHCGRIALLARQLAAHLVDDAFAESAA